MKKIIKKSISDIFKINDKSWHIAIKHIHTNPRVSLYEICSNTVKYRVFSI